MIGIVLAGGTSSRFGTDKALYRFPNQQVNNAQLAVDKLITICDTVLVSANQQNFAELTRQFSASSGVNVISDQPPFEQCGPLSAIYAATCLFEKPNDYLTLAVDYPLISTEVLATIANHGNCYAATPDADHYTLAHFTVDQQTIKDFLLLDDYRLSYFITEVKNCDPVSFSNAALFINYNTPEVNEHEKQK
ncbi:molybdenum cofactor guanylyltransferase [Secundilactobacillus folii]|uniref:NTP transferase domain-containing protein n=1 Tax=Secundilactobacillus folii TaxID=2678357 RepID=A0A7X2XUY7_9LACO|nr:molybdenum cofactor guanylyltransferase [Secundilactobacillus folii]MTV82162.1 NTP transferase domain-containing protein [Secundilactobacillus folii]